MAEAAKKEYTIKINGIAEEIKNTQTLSDALMKLDANIRTVNSSNLTVTRSIKTKTSALTDEERAEQRLTDTIRKAVNARSDQNKAQVEAKLALRDINKEVEREIKINNEAEGSIKQKTLQLAAMKDAYRSLSEEQRNSESVGGAMLSNIKELDKETKTLNAEIGDFQANVGNYPNIDGFSKRLTELNSTGASLIQMFTLGTGVLSLFGVEIGNNDKRMKFLHKIMGLIMISQSALNNLNKKGAVIKSIMSMQEKAHAKATALSTSKTVAATVAQRIFNAVAKVNPYLILASGIGVLIGSLALFSSKTKDTTEDSKEYTSAIDGMKFASEEARDAHDDLIRSLKDSQNEYDIVTGKMTEYGVKMKEFADKEKTVKDKIKAWRGEKLKKIDEEFDNKHFKEFRERNGNKYQTKQEAWVHFQTIKKSKINDVYREPIPLEFQEELDLINIQRNTEKAKQQNYVKNINETNSIALIVDEEEAELKKLEKIYDDEIEATKTRNKEIRDANVGAKPENQVPEIDISQITAKYLKEKEEIRDKYAKKREEAEKNESDKRIAREKKNWEAIIDTEELGTQLITDEYDRRSAEIDIRWNKDRQDIIDRLANEEDLSVEARDALRKRLNIIDKIAAKEHRLNENDRINKTISDNYAGYQKLLEDHEKFLKDFEDPKDLIKRKGPFNIIDIKGTQKNIAEANEKLSGEITRLKEQKLELLMSHENNLAKFGEGSDEFEAEVERFKKNSNDLSNAIIETQEKINANNEEGKISVFTVIKEFMDKYSEEIQIIQNLAKTSGEIFTSVIEMQVEALNEELELINEQYEETKKKQEESANRAQELNQRMQDSTGGSAEATREQIMEEMALKNELDREEQRLAKEKEKREEMIAKKESQLKRKEHLSKMAEATASAAMAIISCYAKGPLLGGIMAAIVGTITAVQLGIMGSQLNKLEDGGMINGPSHSAGGVRIPGTNIEVEGKEFVINKKSTASNPALIRFINDSRRTVTMADLIGVVPSGNYTPSTVTDASQQADERIINAIKEINFTPYVVVTDIEEAGMDVARVRDRSGL